MFFCKKRPPIIELNAQQAHIKATIAIEAKKFERQQQLLSIILSRVNEGKFSIQFDGENYAKYYPYSHRGWILTSDDKKYLELLGYKIETKIKMMTALYMTPYEKQPIPAQEKYEFYEVHF